MRFASLFGAVVAATLVGVTPAKAVRFTTSDELVQVTEVSPGVFDFSQGGFAGGGTLTGSFAGTDLDADGQLASFAGEVTGFSAAFSGSALIPAFTLGFGNLYGLVYDLDGGPLGDGTTGAIEGIAAVGAPATYLAGAGPFGAACDGTNICGLIGSTVPEPGTWLTMVLGLAAVGAALRLGQAGAGRAIASRR